MNANQSITYSLTQNDLKSFTQRVLVLAKARKKSKSSYHMVISWICLFVFFLIIFRVAGDDFMNAGIFPGLIVAIPLIVAVIFSLLQTARLLKPSESGFVLGNRTFITSEAGIEVQGQYYNNKWEWSGVTLIDETHHHLFLFVDNNAAHIIPRRIFSSTAEYEEYRDRIVDIHRHRSNNEECNS